MSHCSYGHEEPVARGIEPLSLDKSGGQRSERLAVHCMGRLDIRVGRKGGIKLVCPRTALVEKRPILL